MRLRQRPFLPAFTLIELVVGLAIALIAVVVIAAAMSGGGRTHHGARQLKDSTQLRGIHQGMILWAQNNKNQYPLPSLIDAADDTIAAPAESKDTTANIISILIYNGFFSPELCVSPAEADPNVRVDDKYEYSSPKTAANPAKALWDPAFNADFTIPGRPGAFSYAHLPPTGERLKDWSPTFSATSAIVGNRGPEIASIARNKDGSVTPQMKIPNSRALLIHGGRNTWEGNIAYNDNHINFEVSLAPPDGATYPDAAKTLHPDCLFFDEPDDASGRNNFLGNFTTSGKTLSSFKSIWD